MALPAADRYAYAADVLTVDTASGAAKIRFDELWQTPQAGMAVSLPAIVSTGDDGKVRLRQGDTFISVASNSAIELSSNAAGDGLVQNVVQEAGSAFYDIAPRESGRFRVQSPYLVAVVKGTQFNVTVANDTSTVALFEGLLRIDAPDIDASVDIVAGQIAQRHRDDPVITVIDMESGDLVAGTGAGTSGSDDADGDDGLAATPNGDIPGGGLTGDDPNGNIVADIDADLGNGEVGVGTSAQLNAGSIGAGASAQAALNLDDGTVGAALDTGLEVGDVALDTGGDAGVDLGSGSVDAGLDTGLAVGETTLDAGVDLDLGLAPDPNDGLVDVDIGIGGDDNAGSDTEVPDDADNGDDLVPDLGDLLGT